jgi:crotonobetaine/carnitine-CoA ligase
LTSTRPLAAEQRDKTLPQLVAERAKSDTDRPFLLDTDGPQVTYGQAYDGALQWATKLRELGVQRGDHVATMLDNCIDGPIIWMAASILGAVDVSVSTAYRGNLLKHALNLSGARILYIDAGAIEPLVAVADELTSVQTVIVRGPKPPELPNLPFTVMSEGDLSADTDQIVPGELPRSHDIACVVLTSGTTGPSKGVLVPWGALATGSTALNDALTAEDILYLTSPANHLIARIQILTAAQVGAAVVLKRAFRTQDFWNDIDRYRCTYTTLVGAMTHFIMGQPESATDAEHSLCKVTMVPLHPQLDQLAQRFGLTHINSAFGMTECPSPIRVHWNSVENIASCGRVPTGWPGWQVRLVDEFDHEVRVGDVGELIVRTEEPWTLGVGYLGMPEQTAQAWRNGWFHTGDAFRQDEQGRFYFVDRIKDSIRRRGENISSFEVESEVNAHPDVAESAAIAVRADDEEDEIKIFVVPAPGRTVDPEALMRFLIDRMARYMVPRYVEVVDSLPKTATQRVQKAMLREREPGEVWDRVAAGVELPSRA